MFALIQRAAKRRAMGSVDQPSHPPAVSGARPCCERLEARELLTVTYDPGTDTYTWTGTGGNDLMEIRKPSSAVRFELNGVLDFSASGFTPVNVVVRGLAGDDNILIGGNISTVMKPLVYGEGGNDVINGGPPQEVIVGGDGNDDLGGNTNRDILIGGNGADRVSGQNGDDIVVASASVYDDPTNANSRQALNDLRFVWTSNNPYNVRVASIRAGVGGTQNARLSDATINEDNAVDNLFGGDESDWFLLNNLDTHNAGAGESIDICTQYGFRVERDAVKHQPRAGRAEGFSRPSPSVPPRPWPRRWFKDYNASSGLMRDACESGSHSERGRTVKVSSRSTRSPSGPRICSSVSR